MGGFLGTKGRCLNVPTFLSHTQLKQRVDELEIFKKATVQREFRMKELREENEMLKKMIEGMEKKD